MNLQESGRDHRAHDRHSTVRHVRIKRERAGELLSQPRAIELITQTEPSTPAGPLEARPLAA
jgi:hypothetical protein